MNIFCAQKQQYLSIVVYNPAAWDTFSIFMKKKEHFHYPLTSFYVKMTKNNQYFNFLKTVKNQKMQK